MKKEGCHKPYDKTGHYGGHSGPYHGSNGHHHHQYDHHGYDKNGKCMHSNGCHSPYDPTGHYGGHHGPYHSSNGGHHNHGHHLGHGAPGHVHHHAHKVTDKDGKKHSHFVHHSHPQHGAGFYKNLHMPTKYHLYCFKGYESSTCEYEYTCDPTKFPSWVRTNDDETNPSNDNQPPFCIKKELNDGKCDTNDNGGNKWKETWEHLKHIDYDGHVHHGQHMGEHEVLFHYFEHHYKNHEHHYGNKHAYDQHGYDKYGKCMLPEGCPHPYGSNNGHHYGSNNDNYKPPADYKPPHYDGSNDGSNNGMYDSHGYNKYGECMIPEGCDKPYDPTGSYADDDGKKKKNKKDKKNKQDNPNKAAKKAKKAAKKAKKKAKKNKKAAARGEVVA